MLTGRAFNTEEGMGRVVGRTGWRTVVMSVLAAAVLIVVLSASLVVLAARWWRGLVQLDADLARA